MTDPVRPDVVEALVAAHLAGRPELLPDNAMPSERERAKSLILSMMLLEAPGRVHVDRVVEILYRDWRAGDPWDVMLDRLQPADVDELRALFPYIPAEVAPHFVRRFGLPTIPEDETP